jgi:hypothetical protein
MAKIRKPNFGIHWQDGVAFLHQTADPEKSAPNMLGLKMVSPFIVQPMQRNIICNHNMPMTVSRAAPEHWVQFLRLCDDPFVKAMLPIPKEGYDELRFFNVSSLYLTLLSKTSSPTLPVVYPIDTVTTAWLTDQLTHTNVQPICLRGVTDSNRALVDQYAKLAADKPRTIVFAGEGGAPSRISQSNVEDLIFLPWEMLGANVVRLYMKGDLFTPAFRKEQILIAKPPYNPSGR